MVFKGSLLRYQISTENIAASLHASFGVEGIIVESTGWTDKLWGYHCSGEAAGWTSARRKTGSESAMTTINQIITNMHGLSINISHSSTCFVSSVCHIFISYLSSACAFEEIIDVPKWGVRQCFYFCCSWKFSLPKNPFRKCLEAMFYLLLTSGSCTQGVTQTSLCTFV